MSTPSVLGIDHVILGVQSLVAAEEVLEQYVGLRVGGGGHHPAFGTENRLVLLADGYIELIAPRPGVTPVGFIGALLSTGLEGWVGFALRVEDPELLAKQARARGFAVEGPSPGRLETGDEFTRHWTTLHFSDPPIPGMPFMIRHHEQGGEHRRLLAGKEGIRHHRLDMRHITDVQVAAPDLDQAVEVYCRAYGLEVSRRGQEPLLDARYASLTLASGCTITLVCPRSAGQGPVGRTLKDRGQGLFSVTLAVGDLSGAVQALRGRGLGIRVDEPEGVLVGAQLQHRQLHGARIALSAAP